MVGPNPNIGAASHRRAAVAKGVGNAAASTGISIEGRFRQAEGKVDDIFDEGRPSARSAAGGSFAGAPEAYADDESQGRRDAGLARQVGDRPLTALLLASAAGYLVSLLIHGRR